MAFKSFPRLKGPPALAQAVLMVGVSLSILYFLPVDTVFLGLNLLNLAAILVAVILGKPFVPRFEQNLVLLGCLLVTLALYGLFRGFGGVETYFLHIFEFFPALLFYSALKLFEIHFGFKKGLAEAKGLIPEDRLDFADKARTEFKKIPGARQAAAQIYKDIAEEGLLRAPAVYPIHIIAMKKYGEMLIYNEARGKSGEGEWYSKKAHELSLKLLKHSEIPPTVH